MPKDFNPGLVFLSYLVAVTASHVTLLPAARVRELGASCLQKPVTADELLRAVARFSAR